MATPRAAGRTWQGGQERRHVEVCEVVTGNVQIPGTAGYRGCWVCGHAGHRAADCSARQATQVQDWMANEIVTHGREWTQVQVQQMMAKAELKAQVVRQQQSWAQVAQQQTGAGQAPAVTRRQKTQAEVAAEQRYAARRRATYAARAARKARQEANAAMDAVRRGEYPKPRAAVAEAKAKVWEAEAQRRAAALQRQRAQVTVQNTNVDRDTAGIALHRGLMARDRERIATSKIEAAKQEQRAAQAELAKQQRAAQEEQRQKQRATKHNGMIPFNSILQIYETKNPVYNPVASA